MIFFYFDLRSDPDFLSAEPDSDPRKKLLLDDFLYAFFNQPPTSLAERADVFTQDRTASNHVTQIYQ